MDEKTYQGHISSLSILPEMEFHEMGLMHVALQHMVDHVAAHLHEWKQFAKMLPPPSPGILERVSANHLLDKENVADLNLHNSLTFFFSQMESASVNRQRKHFCTIFLTTVYSIWSFIVKWYNNLQKSYLPCNVISIFPTSKIKF